MSNACPPSGRSYRLSWCYLVEQTELVAEGERLIVEGQVGVLLAEYRACLQRAGVILGDAREAVT